MGTKVNRGRDQAVCGHSFQCGFWKREEKYRGKPEISTACLSFSKTLNFSIVFAAL